LELKEKGLLEEPAIIIYGACLALIVSHHQGSTGAYHQFFKQQYADTPWAGALPYLWWFCASIALYMLVPLFISLVTRGSFNQRYGFQFGDWRLGLKLSALFLCVMLPAVWFASTLPSFQGQYPLAGKSAYTRFGGEVSWTLFATYELAYAAYFFAWEFLFRGWMVHGIEPKWGRAPAILVQVAPFAVMHLGKPQLETMGSIIAGVALGILSIRTRSFLYGFVLHAAIAVFMDILSVRGA
jgi:membrane protease YdiL (CAAX protease family)